MAAPSTTSAPGPPGASPSSTPPSCSPPSTSRPGSSSRTTPAARRPCCARWRTSRTTRARAAPTSATIGSHDVVVGLTASGRTPYVGGALALARERGALTALVTSNPGAELAALADHLIAVDTGPEAITGSTRLKAGTSQKLVLNAFSTAVMVRLGRTWSNLMVDVVATNAKLRGRVVRILREASGASEDDARRALEAADGELKTALVTLLCGASASRARTAIADHSGSVALALAALGSAAVVPVAPDRTSSPLAARPVATVPTGDLA